MRKGFAVGLLLVGVLAFVSLSQGQEPLTIRLAGFSNDETTVNQLLGEVADLLPGGVEVAFEPVTGDFRERIFNDLAAGGSALADIYYVDIFWAKEAFDTGKLQPLNDFIARSQELGPNLKDVWLDNLVDAFTFDNQIIAIAKDFNSLVEWYNRDAFAAAGVEPLNDQDTWSTFLDKAQRVQTAAGPGTAAIVLNPDWVRFLPFALANGMPLVQNDGCSALGTPAAIEAAAFFSRPHREGFGLTSGDVGAGWPGAAFVEEKGFIVNEGGWILGPIANDNPTLEFAAAPLPLADRTGARANFLFTVGYAIPAELPEARQRAAFGVIEALLSQRANLFVLDRLAIPPRKALLADPNSPLANPQTPFQVGARAVFEATNQAGTIPFSFQAVGGADAFGVPLGKALNAIIVDGADAAQAMTTAALEMNQFMVDQGVIGPDPCPLP